MSIVVEIRDQRRTEDDYVIELQLPEGDGRVVTVLLPRRPTTEPQFLAYAFVGSCVGEGAPEWLKNEIAEGTP
jgi:hypothetical protein